MRLLLNLVILLLVVNFLECQLTTTNKPATTTKPKCKINIFLIFENINIISIFLVISDSSCPKSYAKISNFKDKCFYNTTFSSQRLVTFADANKACANNSGFLPVISSENYFSAMEAIVKATGYFTWVTYFK